MFQAIGLSCVVQPSLLTAGQTFAYAAVLVSSNSSRTSCKLAGFGHLGYKCRREGNLGSKARVLLMAVRGPSLSSKGMFPSPYSL